MDVSEALDWIKKFERLTSEGAKLLMIKSLLLSEQQAWKEKLREEIEECKNKALMPNQELDPSCNPECHALAFVKVVNLSSLN